MTPAAPPPRARRRGRLPTVAAAALIALIACERPTLFELQVTLPPGTTSLDVTPFANGRQGTTSNYLVTSTDGGATKTIGFEVERSVGTLTIEFVAYNAALCKATTVWMEYHSGRTPNFIDIAITDSFHCDDVDAGHDDGGGDPDVAVDGDAGDGGDAGGRGDAGDAPGAVADARDLGNGDASICPPVAGAEVEGSPDAGTRLDAGASTGDPCQQYCSQIFDKCPVAAADYFASVADCLVKCAKIDWPVDDSPSPGGGNSISCRLYYLQNEQCAYVTPNGGRCGTDCENYRHLLSKACGAVAGCVESTLPTACIRAAVEAARNQSWCGVAQQPAMCAGCFPP